jgi:hemerythrin HHE cation binding domain-containing protein
MNRDEIAQQAAIEHEMLKHIAAALRATIGMKTAEDITRKLTGLRFISQSFQRHLEHVMALEEFDGYMNIVTESYPELTDRTKRLRQEHDRFREELGRLVWRLDRVSSQQVGPFEEVCQELTAMLERVSDHNQREMALIQEAFSCDTGGEG